MYMVFISSPSGEGGGCLKKEDGLFRLLNVFISSPSGEGGGQFII